MINWIFFLLPFCFGFTFLFAGFTSIGASSEVCDNYKNCRVVETLWYHNMLRGVVILPKQILPLDKWMTFNNLPPNLNPLYSATPIDVDSHSDQNTVYILLEANIYPDLDAIENGAEVVTVCSFIHNLFQFLYEELSPS